MHQPPTIDPGTAPPPSRRQRGRTGTGSRRIKGQLALISVLLIFGSLLIPNEQAEAASSCTARNAEWRTNCTTSRSRHNYSELARGAQRGIRASGDLIVADGVFGSGTERAVVAFQRKKGLDDDGIVGPQTWTALYWELGRGGGTQQYQKYTDNGVHTLTRFHHNPRWKIKKWNRSQFYTMDSGWRG